MVVVVMCGDEDIIRKFMLAAYDNDMTSGDYVFISLTLLPSERVRTPWLRHDARDDDAKKAYQSLLEAREFYVYLIIAVMFVFVMYFCISVDFCYLLESFCSLTEYNLPHPV